MITTSAYAATAADKPLAPHTIERREPRAHEVLIDIAYCGVCHSDLHQVRDEWGGARFPLVPGHEIVGHVAQVGSAVTKWKVGDTVWPTPRRLPLQTLMNYGYEGEVLLPIALTAPANARPGSTAALSATVRLLVCKDICIPETARLSLALPVAKAPAANAAWGPAIQQTLAAAPRPGGLTAVMATSGGALKLAVTGKAVTGAGPIPWGYAALVIVYVLVAGAVVWILRRLANAEVTA